MKRLLPLILMQFSISSFSQHIVLSRNPETNIIEYTELVKVDSAITKDQLFSKAKEWIAISFKSANDVIQMDDKVNGIIIAKGNIPVNGGLYLDNSRIDFTLKIQVKDGRYKYWFNNFIHNSYEESYSGGPLENEKPECGNIVIPKNKWNALKIKFDNDIKLIILSLHQFISGKQKNEDNW
jgi:hypothetical protein